MAHFCDRAVIIPLHIEIKGLLKGGILGSNFPKSFGFRSLSFPSTPWSFLFPTRIRRILRNIVEKNLRKSLPRLPNVYSDKTVAGSRKIFSGFRRSKQSALQTFSDCGVKLFHNSTTANVYLILCISVPPEKPRIFTEEGKEIRLKLGPYHIGESLRMRCEAYGGRPLPKVHFKIWK